MFDFHVHSTISFDGIDDARVIAEEAARKGLKEICFTDHWDYKYTPQEDHDLFSLGKYAEAYDSLTVDGLKIRRGVEFGMTVWNVPHAKDLLAKRNFDFVIGSLHYLKDGDPYYADFWKGRDAKSSFRLHLEETLRCVKLHQDFDVLGHLTYICKSAFNPTHEPVMYQDFREVCDEIMKVLVQNGKGMEVNTSGVDKAGVFLPEAIFLKRFRELGGEIVTVGSDAHNADRVGQYTKEAIEMVKDIFGYVCTFENRKPIFHR